MTLEVTNYKVCGEEQTNTDKISIPYDEKKWGRDEDVERAYAHDECINQFGVDIEDGFDLTEN